MHELSIATSVLESVSKTAKENNAIYVNKVELVVGTSSAIIEEALTEAFSALCLLDEYTLFKNCKFLVESKKSISICIDCGVEFSHGIGAHQCPQCRSYNTQIIQGTDIYIKQIEIEN